MIHVAGLHKSFGPVAILNGIDLTVAAGEVAALIGPSGSGKSTLLRCLNGLETFDSGSVECFGSSLSATGSRPHPTKSLVELRRKVGMVFQQFHLFAHMTALDNVLSGPVHALGESRDSARPRAFELLDQVGLKHKADARPSELSGGQQQRVAIARALAVQPQAVLFDEPTSALDPAMADEVITVFVELARQGQTMVVVTHDLDLARRATTVHRLEAGRVAASGAPDAVLTAEKPQ